jgi:hypothetical protein
VPRRSNRIGATLFGRAARVAYAFVMMNGAAVAGLFAALTRRNVWR